MSLQKSQRTIMTNCLILFARKVGEVGMKSLFKRLNTSGHFPDFKHTAKGQRDNKKIRARKERRMLKEEREAIEFAREFMSDAVHETAKQFRRQEG